MKNVFAILLAATVLFGSAPTQAASDGDFSISKRITDYPIPVLYLEKIRIKNKYRRLSNKELVQIQKLVQFCFRASMEKNRQDYPVRINCDLMILLRNNLPEIAKLPSEQGIIMGGQVSRFLDSWCKKSGIIK